MRSLSVVQVCADRGIAPGSTKGAAQHLRGIAAGLMAAGHRVVTYAARPPEGDHPAPVHPLDQLDPTQPLVAGADVIYERYSLGHLRGLELARALGARFVLEVNAPLVDEALAHRPTTVAPHHREAEDTLVAQADLLITVSRPLARWAAGRRTAPTVTVTNGFEPAWFPPAGSKAGPGPHPTPGPGPVLGFIGHPKPWHGADRLPALLRSLGRRGHHPKLLIIGGGPGADQVTAEGRRLGVADQITVTGALPPGRASGLLTTATIGLAPYRRQDPFYFCPLKVIDYLAAGLPVVTTAQGDIPELVGAAGAVVDPDDDEALAGAVAELLAHPERARRLGHQGRQRALATLTWNAAAARTAAAILALDTPTPTPTPSLVSP